MIFRTENGGYFVYVAYSRDPDTDELTYTGKTTVQIYNLEDFEKFGRKVKSLLNSATPVSSGNSKCHPMDQFSKRAGLTCASKRAFKKLKLGFKWDPERHVYSLFRQEGEVANSGSSYAKA